MALLVSLATPESPVDPVPKVYPEILMVTLEDPELQACQEIQASQVVVAMTAPPATTASQEVQVSPEQRGVLEKEDGLEYQVHPVSLGRRVSLDSQEEEDQMGLLEVLEVLEVLEPKVCLEPLVWMD